MGYTKFSWFKAIVWAIVLLTLFFAGAAMGGFVFTILQGIASWLSMNLLGGQAIATGSGPAWVIYSFFAFVLASGVATFTLFLRNWVNDELRDAYWDGKLAERREDMRRRQQNELDATSARDTDAEEPTDEE